MSIRKEGYYWIKLFDSWCIGYFNDDFESLFKWIILSFKYTEDQLQEIDENRIERKLNTDKNK
jgi:hypothetical protein